MSESALSGSGVHRPPQPWGSRVAVHGTAEVLLSPLHVFKDVALVISHGQLEGQGRVVALQHGDVVVQDGQLAPGVAQEGVGPPRVVHIVNCGSNEGGYLIDRV